METTAPPIIAAIETVNAAYAAARHVDDPREPALMIHAHTRIADALDVRIALLEVELHTKVDPGTSRPDLDGWARPMPLALADPVKFWALQRAITADRRDSKAARDLADWWGKRPSPRRRARARRG